MSDEHIYKSHNKSLLLYHLVFPAKYRKKIFDDNVDKKLIYKKDSYYQTFFILICSFIFLISIISFLLKIRIYNKFNTK